MKNLSRCHANEPARSFHPAPLKPAGTATSLPFGLRLGDLISPVLRNNLTAFWSSSLRSLFADGMPMVSANSFSSVVYQYPLSNWARVIEVDSFAFCFKQCPPLDTSAQPIFDISRLFTQE